MENFIFSAVLLTLCRHRKSVGNVFSSDLDGGDLNFRKPHGDSELRNKQRVKKLNLWGKNRCR